MYKKVLITLGLAIIVCLTFNYSNQHKYNTIGYWNGISMKEKLAQDEKNWLAQKEEIRIGVTDDFLPLLLFNNHQAKGFLADYMYIISDEISTPITFVPILAKDISNSLKSGQIDGVFMIHTQSIASQVKFTTPLLPIKGSIFFPKGSDIQTLKQIENKKILLVDQTPPSPAFISLGNSHCEYTFVSNVEEGVLQLSSGNYDGLAGNKMAISYTLKQFGFEDQYQSLPDYLYEKNISIAIPNNSPLYDILNQSIYYLDKNKLNADLSEKWFGLPYPLQNNAPFKDVGILLFIVFAGVVCVFYLFYGSNKNLYDELADRMEQVNSSRNELQTTFDGVSYYMAELDRDYCIVTINRAFEFYLNMRRRDAKGKNICKLLLLNKELDIQLQGDIFATFHEGLDHQIECAIGRKILEIRLFPIKNAREQVVKVLMMAIDVTTSRSAERQMIQNNKMIAIGQLAAGVAHELRNPLGLIRNYCFLLKTEAENNPDMKEKAIVVIEKAVDRSGKIIDNLLNFSRISNNKKDEIHLHSQILSFLSLQKKALMQKGIQLQLFCDEDITAFIVTESLEMILINLISNAGDAMSDGGKIHILCTQEQENVKIEVKDTGTGISAEVIDEIFHPFFTTKEKKEGNGLGLYLVYNEVQKMNGNIYVESEENVGTSFIITFPKNSEV